MKAAFRTVSFWQAALMILPDAAFFDLIRSALGNVKTPFNKQNLVEELSRFIVRPEIQENIHSYIDTNDRRIIAAIALLSEPVPGELESFFTGEYSYVELQSLLLNLEERLIIYRFRDNDILRIALNPRLENILAPLAENRGILFTTIESDLKETISATSTTAENIVFSNRTLAALFAYLLYSDVQVKEDGSSVSFSFRKKTAELGKTLFPDLDIESTAGGLLALDLITLEGESLFPNETKINAFKELSDRERFEYLAGGIALFLHKGRGAFYNRGLLRSTVHLISNFGEVSKNQKILPEATMIKLAELWRRQEAANWSMAAVNGQTELPPAGILLHSLTASGLYSLITINGKTCYCPLELNPAEPAGKETDKSSPLIAMDSGFSCILYPEISFTDAIDLAVFSYVEETGTTVRFLLSRDSVIRGFDRGYSANYLWQLLDRLSCSRAPESLKWNLLDWEKRWKEVSLNQGVILSLGGDRSYLAETEPLSSMIKQNIAPGIYLLSVDIKEAASALHSAGVDIFSRPNINTKNQVKQEAFERAKIKTHFETFAKTEKPADIPEQRIGKIKEQFRTALNSMKLSKQEREELESRIERRVIVSESQLKDTSLRYEKLEARSLDYVGKTGLVKQAIVSASLLELSCLNGEKILGYPESLEKKSGEMVLSIKPRDGGEPAKIPLGKISFIRRIKQSIFGV